MSCIPVELDLAVPTPCVATRRRANPPGLRNLDDRRELVLPPDTEEGRPKAVRLCCGWWCFSRMPLTPAKRHPSAGTSVVGGDESGRSADCAGSPPVGPVEKRGFLRSRDL